MSSVNKVILVGRLGADPETRAVGETQVSNFNVATSDRWTDRNSGEKKEKTEWHRVQAWGKQSELVDKYLKKGTMVFVEGSLQTRDWTDDSGNKRYVTEIRAQRLQILSPRNGDKKQPVAAGVTDESSDDIPF